MEATLEGIRSEEMQGQQAMFLDKLCIWFRLESDVVREFIEGLAKTYPRLQYLDEFPNVVLRADVFGAKCDKVAVISGGASGHEPAHAGFVGQGMLAAAICGDVFASPSVDSILSGIRAITGAKGCLLIVKNYIDDRANFGLAAEKAKSEGYALEMVIVEDECALPTFGVEGRRGFAGTILVHKVAGAAAASGLSLSEVAGEAKRAAKMVGTYGVALSVCTLPGQVASDRLGPGKMELCPGIRGEQGVNVADIQPADAIVSQVLKEILSPEAKNVPITRGDRVVLMVNGLGATPTMELMIAAGKAVPELQLEHGLAVDRVYTGSFMTSLDMAGFSISVMKADQAILDWLDAPTNAPYWPFRDEAQQLAALQLQVETLKSVNEDFKRVNEALTGQNHYLNKLNTYHFNLAQSLERQLRSTTAHYHSQVSYRDQRISQLQNTMAEQDKQIELKSQKIMEQLLKIDEAMKWKSKYEAERALNTKEPSKDKEVLAGELMNAITAFYGEPLEKIKERLERLQKRIGDSASTDDNAPQRIDPSFYMERLKSTNAYKEMLSVFDTLYNLEVQKVEALQKVKKAQDRLFEELEVDYPLLTFVPRKGNSGASH